MRFMFREIGLAALITNVLVSLYLVLWFRRLKRKSKTAQRLVLMFHTTGIFWTSWLAFSYARPMFNFPAWVWAVGLLAMFALKTYGMMQFVLHMTGDIDKIDITYS